MFDVLAQSAPATAQATTFVASDAVGPIPTVLFYLFAAITLVSAYCVALAGNIVRAAVALLFALGGMSGLYFLLNAEFLAAVQLVVYVGGTLILIIFGVMLTSKLPGAAFEPKRYEIFWALVLGLFLTGSLLVIFLNTVWPGAGKGLETTPTHTVQDLGRALLDPKGYLVPFELVSVLLLAVMIGAAYLAKSRKPKDTTAGTKPTLGATPTKEVQT